MHIFMTGGTGFIGSTLCHFWRKRGHEISLFVRDQHKARHRLGDGFRLFSSFSDIAPATKFDAVVNLAGAPIAAKLWTKTRRKLLRSSRIKITEKLVALLKHLDQKPHTFISASAAGYYGRSDNRWLNEEAPPQDIFMSSLCKDWEEAAAPITNAGVRLVIPRISVVLDTSGGALPSLLRPFRFGLGATFGAGQQYFPWIHKYDLIRMFDFMLETPSITGPINAVAPEAVTAESFNRQLAETLHRPLFLRIPSPIVRAGMGEMADLLLEGQRLSANKLLEHGFVFRFPTLEGAFNDLLNP